MLANEFPEMVQHNQTKCCFKITMHSIFDSENMRAVGEFNSVDLILVAHKLTSAGKVHL